MAVAGLTALAQKPRESKGVLMVLWKELMKRFGQQKEGVGYLLVGPEGGVHGHPKERQTGGPYRSVGR
jgi:ribulose 1,5-bisphosphate carboxylase large subunit-like protein